MDWWVVGEAGRGRGWGLGGLGNLERYPSGKLLPTPPPQQTGMIVLHRQP